MVNVARYGYLYNWPAVMHGESSSSTNPSGVQGICPNGWHVPSDAEWVRLFIYVSSQPQYQCDNSSDNFAKALASTIGWDSSDLHVLWVITPVPIIRLVFRPFLLAAITIAISILARTLIFGVLRSYMTALHSAMVSTTITSTCGGVATTATSAKVSRSVVFAIRADRKSAKRQSGLKGKTRRKTGENLNRFRQSPRCYDILEHYGIQNVPKAQYPINPAQAR